MRSLGRLGIPVWGVDAERFVPPFFSRYIKGHFTWDIARNSDSNSLDFLHRIAKTIGRSAILIPTTDVGALFVSEHASALRKHYLFHAMPQELVAGLCSKKEMYFLARQHSIPTPECTFPHCRRDVVEFASRCTFPVMLKGIDGKRLEKAAGKRMYIVRSEREMLAFYDRMEDPVDPNIMLQEYIPGGDDTVWMFNGYFDRHSECLIGMTGKKIHQYPIHTGLTSLGVCIHNETVVRLTQTFMRALGYQGILDIGFRYDARDGTYKVLDVNPRIGATFRLFVAQNGMDVARALYFDLTGQPVRPGVARDGRKWVVEDIDLISSIRYLTERKLGMRTLMRSYSGVQEGAFFAWDDPLPFLFMGVSALMRLIPGVTPSSPSEKMAPRNTNGHRALSDSVGIPAPPHPSHSATRE